jgi:hypothetical protein
MHREQRFGCLMLGLLRLRLHIPIEKQRLMQPLLSLGVGSLLTTILLLRFRFFIGLRFGVFVRGVVLGLRD